MARLRKTTRKAGTVRAPSQEAIRRLRSYYLTNGCVRIADPDRRKEEGKKYKKGYEVRLVASTQRELFEIQGLLVKVQVAFGRPYQKARQVVQPIYGRANTERFLELIGEPVDF